jgi:hypothetical protein
MTGFTFDAKAALHQARERRGLPTLPTLPTDHPTEGEKVGTVGKVGTVCASDPEMTPYDLALDLYQERAAIREFLGDQDRYTADRGAWAEVQLTSGLRNLGQWRPIAEGTGNSHNSY